MFWHLRMILAYQKNWLICKSFGNWEDPPPPFGKNSQKIPFFWGGGVPKSFSKSARHFWREPVKSDTTEWSHCSGITNTNTKYNPKQISMPIMIEISLLAIWHWHLGTSRDVGMHWHVKIVTLICCLKFKGIAAFTNYHMFSWNVFCCCMYLSKWRFRTEFATLLHWAEWRLKYWVLLLPDQSMRMVTERAPVGAKK